MSSSEFWTAIPSVLTTCRPQ